MGSTSRRFDGFFKSEFRVNETVGRSVSYVRDGKLLGGNSGFAHIGSYRFEGDTIAVEVTSRRHNFGPNFKSLLGSDISTIDVRGQAVGDAFHFEGGSPQMPTARFRSVMTPLDESELAPPGTVGADGISNGLYSIHLKVLDGMAGGLTGVMLLNNGRIFGGDAFFYYLGSYSSSNGRWKGQMINQEHTPARGEDPVFGGHEIGIGFSGTCDAQGGTLEGTRWRASGAYVSRRFSTSFAEFEASENIGARWTNPQAGLVEHGNHCGLMST